MLSYGDPRLPLKVNPHFEKYLVTPYFGIASNRHHFAGNFPPSAHNEISIGNGLCRNHLGGCRTTVHFSLFTDHCS